VFSPDGARMAFIRAERFAAGGMARPSVHVMNNDGGGAMKVCDFAWVRPVLFTQALLTWADNGFLYWSEDSAFLYRAPMTGGLPEVVCEFHPSSDMPDQPWSRGNLYAATVSQDGRRAASESNGGGRLFRYGLTTCTQTLFTDGGCRGAIAPDGNTVIHMLVGYPASNQTALIESFETGAILGSITAPGVGPDVESENEFTRLRFSRSSSRHVVCCGSRALQGKAYLYDINTSSYGELGSGLEPSYFRPGALPPPAQVAVLAADRQTLFFDTATVSVSQRVTVTAGATVQGTGAVSVTGGGTWLRVAVDRTPVGYSLRNTVERPGLTPTACIATVTFTAQGAANAVTYRVVLNNGLPAVWPTGLKLTQVSARAVLASWFDNSPNEDGFLVQRRTNSSAWQTAGIAPAGASSFRDSMPGVEQYWYRVGTIAGAWVSPAPDSAAIEVRQYPTVTILAPAAGTTVAAGSQVHVTWRTVNVTTLVTVNYSLDDGEEWHTLASLQAGDTIPGDYTWLAPDTASASVRIRIDEYNGHALAEAGPFTIVSAAGVTAPGRIPAASRTSRPAMVVRMDGSVHARGADRGATAVYRLDGTFAEISRLPGGLGRLRLAPGCYIAAATEGR